MRSPHAANLVSADRTDVKAHAALWSKVSEAEESIVRPESARLVYFAACHASPRVTGIRRRNLEAAHQELVPDSPGHRGPFFWNGILKPERELAAVTRASPETGRVEHDQVKVADQLRDPGCIKRRRTRDRTGRARHWGGGRLLRPGVRAGNGQGNHRDEQFGASPDHRNSRWRVTPDSRLLATRTQCAPHPWCYPRDIRPFVVDPCLQAFNTSRMRTAMSSADGSTAARRSGWYGIGTSRTATRSTGASSCQNASRATTAAISAPNPAVIVSSCTMRQRPVFLTDVSTASRSHGAIVRRSMSSTEPSTS